MPAQTLTSLIYRQEVEDEKETEEKLEKEEEKYSKENVRGSVIRDSKSGERREHALAIFLPLLC